MCTMRSTLITFSFHRLENGTSQKSRCPRPISQIIEVNMIYRKQLCEFSHVYL